MRTNPIRASLSTASLGAALATALATTLACGPAGQICHAQNDCPNGEGCSADGVCVAMHHRDSLVAQYGDAPGGGADGPFGGAAGGGDNGFTDPGGDTLNFGTEPFTGVGNGNIGPLTLAADSAITVDPDLSWGMYMYYDPNDGGEMGLAIISPATIGMQDMICTPGSYDADVNSIDADLWAQACTMNEVNGEFHYDEPVSSSVDVGAPDPQTGFVPLTIHQTSAQTDLTVDVALPSTNCP